MKLYTMAVEVQDQDGTEVQKFADLAEGDVQAMRNAAAINRPQGSTVLVTVTEQR